MASPSDFYPSHDDFMEFEPEELGVLLLRHMASVESANYLLHLGNYFGDKAVSQYIDTSNDPTAVKRRLTEAWIWLENEGMLAPLVEHGRDWVFVTGRGHRLLDEQNWEAFSRARLLGDVELGTMLVQKAKPPFLRGDYESAVFEAFKVVEVEVRKASKLADERIGVSLMRDAFKPESGPLTNASSIPGEQQAVSDLFAGAIGLFKNPSSHRTVDWTAQEAAEVVLFANYLLRLIDSRGATVS